MSGFLKEYSQYTEEDYKWKLSVPKRIVMLADSPRVEYKKNKTTKNIQEKEEIIKEGDLGEFLGDFAQKR